MPVTIRDVAKVAGVSIKTVSNVLNGYPYLTEETKAKVEAAVADLDYRPNIAARNLRRGRTGVVALAVPSLDNPYFAEIANLIVREAEARNLTVLINATHRHVEREKHVADGFGSQLLDGMFLLPSSISAQALRARRDKTPLVLLGEREVPTIDRVAIDSRAAAVAAVNHVHEQGCRKIAAIGASVPHAQGQRGPGAEPQLRQRGYEEALTSHGMTVDPALSIHLTTDQTPEAVGAAVGDLLATQNGVDGIFAFNDRAAIGVIHALTTRGVKVPDDIAVIGIDDNEAARLSNPSLSTIAPDKAGIARIAVEMLADRIAGADHPARQVVADFALIARGSTGR